MPRFRMGQRLVAMGGVTPRPVPSKSTRRWLQFGFLPLFLAVSLFCIWLGLQVSRADRQRKGVAWIRELGGAVSYQAYAHTPTEIEAAITTIRLPPDSSAILTMKSGIHRTLVRDKTIVGVERLSRNQVRIVGKKQGTAILTLWNRQNRSRLVAVNVTDAPQGRIAKWLGYLAPLDEHFSSYVYAVRFGTADVADHDLIRLTRAFPKLASLDLSGTGTTDEGLAWLSRLDNLQWLDLTDTSVTDVGVERLREALPDCTIKR